VRLNPLISPQWDKADEKWKPPGTWTAAQFDYLANKIHLDALAQGDVDYISALAGWWIADQVTNQPIRMHADDLKPEVGQTTFSDARKAWEAIRG
jgi:hypothetical protein